MGRVTAFALVTVVCGSWMVAEPSARGADASNEPSAAAQQKPAQPKSLGHRYQLGLGLRFGSGYRIVAPYNEENCGDVDDQGSNKSVCTGAYPPWLELSPSFGITDSLEVLVDVRLLLDKPSYTSSNGLVVAPGIKYYTDPEGLFKFFLTIQLAFENQPQSANQGLASFDFGVRSALGLHFDILRYIGFYAQAGLIIGFTRWLSFLTDFAGGVQVRY